MCYATRLAGLDLSPAALSFLREFGGLTLYPHVNDQLCANGSPVIFHPAGGPPNITDSHRLRATLGLETFPIGIHTDGDATIVMDQTGRVFMCHWSDDFYMERQDAAVINFLNAFQGQSLNPKLLFATDEDLYKLDEYGYDEETEE